MTLPDQIQTKCLFWYDVAEQINKDKSSLSYNKLECSFIVLSTQSLLKTHCLRKAHVIKVPFQRQIS